MPSFHPVSVAGFLLVNGKALVVRRSSHETHLTGHYELPGGKVEGGEHPEKALIREFLEETGINVAIVKPYRVFCYHSPAGHTIEIVYLVKPRTRTRAVRLSEEHDDYRWITKGEVAKLKASSDIQKNLNQGFALMK